MATKLAFMFVADHVESEKHRAEFTFGDVVLYVRGVANYDEAKKMAIELVDQGVTGIELCAGFGNEGTGIIANAVKGKAIVGAVRFDTHPAFGMSGDRLFGA